MDEVLKDERFALVGKDRRFRKQRDADRRFKVDKRFNGMFTEGSFNSKHVVDKRGKPIASSSKEKLSKYYCQEKSSSEKSSSDGSSDEESGESSMIYLISFCK